MLSLIQFLGCIMLWAALDKLAPLSIHGIAAALHGLGTLPPHYPQCMPAPPGLFRRCWQELWWQAVSCMPVWRKLAPTPFLGKRWRCWQPQRSKATCRRCVCSSHFDSVFVCACVGTLGVWPVEGNKCTAGFSAVSRMCCCPSYACQTFAASSSKLQAEWMALVFAMPQWGSMQKAITAALANGYYSFFHAMLTCVCRFWAV